MLVAVPFQVWHFAVEQLFYFEILISMQKNYIFWIFNKTLFKLKNIRMFFITNVLHKHFVS
jgi:hypothetical protein